jgi:hypothetical protein
LGSERQVLAVFPTYACAVSLSLMAISERRHRFGVNEIAAGLPEEAMVHAVNVRGILRRRSDLRFHIATRREEPGSVVIGYTFDDRFHHRAGDDSTPGAITARNVPAHPITTSGTLSGVVVSSSQPSFRT